MAALRHFLESLFNPFFFSFFLFAVSLVFLMLRGHSRGAKSGLLLALLCFLLFSTGFIPKYLTGYLEGQYDFIAQANPEIQWVVVLGGGQADGVDAPANNLLYTASLRRLIEGVRLYRQLPKAQLVLSGGGYNNKNASEAKRLNSLINWFGLSSSDVILESESINTADQARELSPLLHGKSFYLVTSAIHMPRAMALFRRQGLHPIAAPTDFTYYWYDERWEKTYIPNPNNLVYLNIAWHEVLGRLWAKIRGLD